MQLNATRIPGKENFTPTLLTHLKDFTAKFHNYPTMGALAALCKKAGSRL